MVSPWPIVASATVLMMSTFSSANNDWFIAEEKRAEMDNFELPLSLAPLRYVLKLHPRLDDGYYNGSVVIKIWCHDVTDTIILNAHKELDIIEDEIILMVDKQEQVPVSLVSRNEENDSLTIVLARNLNTSDEFCYLHIKFGGQMKYLVTDYSADDISGGFLLGKFENVEKKATSTYAIMSSYPNFARKLFPCFDNPAYKAEFHISVARPVNFSSLSIMPIESTEPADNGYEWDHFQLSLPIPPFSVSVLVSELDSFDPVNVSSPLGEFQLQIHLQKNRYSLSTLENLKNLPKIMNFLQEYFNMTYPVPKLDVVLLPNFVGYNYVVNSLGLIVMPPWIRDEDQGMKLALVNQFIQCVSTPRDWKTFNISFMLGSYVARREIKDAEDKESLLELDAQNVYEEFSSEFNYSLYEDYSMYSTSRGEWFLKMINHALGKKAFKDAMRHYLLLSMYSTYTEEKFWEYVTRFAWEEKTFPFDLEVEWIADSWLHNKLYRFPVLTVMRNYEENSATLEQHTFTTDLPRNLTQEEEQHLWWIPFTYLTPMHLNPDVMNPCPATWMKDREFTISNLETDEKSFIIVNSVDSGMFLVNYDSHNWRLISLALINLEPSLMPVVRRKVLHDALLLARGGELDYGTALNMTLFLLNEEHPAVWMPLLDSFQNLETLYLFSSVEDKINTYLKKLLRPMMESGKGEPDYSVDEDYASFWYTAKSIYDRLGNQRFIKEARRRFEETSSTISIRDEEMDLDLFCPEFMKNISDDWLTHTVELEVYLNSMYQIRTFMQRNIAKCPNYIELIQRMLNSFLDEDMIFSIELWEQMTDLITSTKVAENITFDYFLQNYKELKKKFYFMKDMWTTMVTKITRNVRTEEGLKKLTEFYDAHKEKLGYTQEVVEASIKDVRTAVEWVKKNGPDIEYWFENVLPQYQ